MVLARKLGRSRRLLRAAVTVGILVGAVSYVLGAWVRPVMEEGWLREREALVELGFALRTPVAIARHLRFVEANPRKSTNCGVILRINGRRIPFVGNCMPLWCWWSLGLLNVLLGVLAAELTVDLTRGRRRNTCVGLGLVGANHVFSRALSRLAPDQPLRAGVPCCRGSLLPGHRWQYQLPRPSSSPTWCGGGDTGEWGFGCRTRRL